MSNINNSRSDQMPKRLFPKVILFSFIAGGVALFMGNQATADSTMKLLNKSNINTEVVTGNVTKTLEQFSLTTEQGTQYHVYDPDAILDKLAQQRINQDGLYELDNVKVKAIVSDVGNYGHMGYYQHQITIIGLAES